MKNALFILLFLAALSGCKEKEEPISQDTTQPEIIKLTTDKTSIMIGADAAIITCEATGGNLEYEWDVLLGDIIPMNAEASQVRYSGAECCAGEKEITCTVKNDKGEDQEVITITILEL